MKLKGHLHFNSPTKKELINLWKQMNNVIRMLLKKKTSIIQGLKGTTKRDVCLQSLLPTTKAALTSTCLSLAISFSSVYVKASRTLWFFSRNSYKAGINNTKY